MAILLRCPACSKKYSAPNVAKARGAACKSCHTKLILPAGPDADGEGDRAAESTPFLEQSNILFEMPELPKQIGRYQVRGQLGVGAFGQVFLAFDPNLGREVALKVPHADYLTNPKVAERFVREARAGASLLHPHIVPVYDAGQDAGLFFIVSAYIKGHTLQDMLATGRWDFRRSVELVRRLAEALAYAHKQGIVHRDVKPANILIDEQGLPRLTDFGLASLKDAEQLTKLGASLGTPAYMAPEQVHGSKSTSIDQYSLGIVLYELLCGQVPFDGPGGYVMHSHGHTPPPLPRSHNPEIPHDLEVICLKTLAKKAEDRYPDCQALADALKGWLDARPPVPEATGEAHASISPKVPQHEGTRGNSSLPTVLILGSLGMLIAMTCCLSVGYVIVKKVLVASPLAQARQSVPEKQEPRKELPATGRLRIQPLAPVTLTAGKSQEVLIGVERIGCSGPIDVQLRILPAGITARTDPIPRDSDSTKLHLNAGPDVREFFFETLVLVSLDQLTAEQPLRVFVKPAIGVDLPSEFPAIITKVQGQEVSFFQVTTEKKGVRATTGVITLSAAPAVQVSSGQYIEKKLVAGDAIEGGLQNTMFANIKREPGIQARITLDRAKEITQILLLPKKK